MKTSALGIAICMLVLAAAALGTATERIYLSGHGPDDAVMWRFFCTGGRNSGVWTTIPVPSQWEQHGFGGYNYGQDPNKSDEKGIYKTVFELPELKSRRVFLFFEGVMTDTLAKVNGEQAGPAHQGGFTLFFYEITNLAKRGRNELEVEVSKESAEQCVNQAERWCDSWVFGGIYRPVYLEIYPEEFIERVAIDAGMDGRFKMDVYLDGVQRAGSIRAVVKDSQGQAVGSTMSEAVRSKSRKIRLEGRFEDMKLWSHERPNLYTATVELRRGDESIHSLTQRFGFRTFELRAGEGFFLNGHRVLLKGVCRHCFRPDSGRALSRADSVQDARMIKSMNMNTVRCSHYAPDKHFLEVCDEMGLLVVHELNSWSKPLTDSVGARMVKELVTRDINHPCVVMWDNGNHYAFNPSLEPEFYKWDIQGRRVLHLASLNETLPMPADETLAPVDTRMYPSYGELGRRLAGKYVTLPIEVLHGLYDGGGGASCADYWRLMCSSPRGGGMFLWAYADEGVLRTDTGKIDVQGNKAPDGMLGPWLEKEASYFALRDIFSPVQIRVEKLTEDFNGELTVENLYLLTNPNRCRFKWELLRVEKPAGQSFSTSVTDCGSFAGPNVDCGQKGTIKLALPDDWAEADILRVTAVDRAGAEIRQWAWPVKAPSAYVPVTRPGYAIRTEQTEREYIVRTSGATFAFDRATARLLNVKKNNQELAFAGGPDLVFREYQPIEPELAKNDSEKYPLEGRRLKDSNGKEARLETKADKCVISLDQARGFDRLRWTVFATGVLGLEYSYSLTGEYDFHGVTFDYPEQRIRAIKWMGSGPQRVWKNRMEGPKFGVWEKPYKDLEPGKDFDYPFFKGYHSNMYRLLLQGRQEKVQVSTETDGLFFRVYTPRWGRGQRVPMAAFPQGDVSFLHAIAPIGTKWRAAYELGPEAGPNRASGSFSGVLYFRFAADSDN